MTRKTINIGRAANDKTGDPIRVAFRKVNENFTELYARAVNTDAQTLTLLGSTLSISGGNSVTLPNTGGSGDRLVNGDLELVLDSSGTLTTPLLLPRLFTAVLDEAHRTVGSGSYTGPAWAFHLEWQCSQNGQVELIADNGPLPSLVNGYANGQTFVFTSADHGIPDYTLTVVLSNVVQAGPAGWTANLSFSPPPAYPPTIASSGAIKLASNGNGLVLGTDGRVTFPDGATINSSEFSAAPNSRLYLYGASDTEGSGRDVRIYGGDAGSASTNSYDGGRVRIQGGLGVNGAPGGYVRLRTYGADNNSYSLTLDNDGVVYLPTNGIQFQDGSVQTTAFQGGDTNVWVEDFISANNNLVQGATSVEYDADGNAIAVFSITDPNNNTFSNTLVAKFDTTGTKQWEVIFQGGNYTDGWGLAVDPVNNKGYVAGRTTVSGGYDQSLLTKIDLANGNIVWTKKIDFEAASNSPVVDVGRDGNPVMVGYANNGTDDYVTVTKLLASDGSVVWCKTLDGYGDERASGMAIGPNNEVVVIGYEDYPTAPNAAATLYTDPVSNVNWTNNVAVAVGNDFTCSVSFTNGVPTFTNVVDRVGNRSPDDVISVVNGTSFGGATPADDMTIKVATVSQAQAVRRVLVAKFSSSGTLQWQKSVEIDSGKECSGADADIDSLGNIYVCGNYYDINDNNQVMFMFQMDSAGAGQWTRRVKGNCQDSATSIVVGPDDHLYLSAVTGNNGLSDFSLVLAKYNRDGTVVWQRLLDNTTTWTFGGSWWFGSGGGSNLAVKTGYLVVAGGFGDPFGTPPHGILAQVNVDGTQFATGNYDFKSATFSGLLTGAPNTVTDTRTVGSANPGIIDFDPDYGYNQNQLTGTLYVAGGGTVSIGDITFSGNRMIGAGADSGDGNNFDTIQLVPDSTLYNNDQYLIIDPTGPSHIHIRAGGTQDSSSALLFLGGEQTNVLVADSDHSVNIRTWNGDATNFEWKFNNAGNTVFPTLTVQRGDNPSGTIQGQTLRFGNANDQAIITTPDGNADNAYSQRLVINPGKGYNYGEGGDIYLWAGRGGDGSGSGGDIKIRGGQGGSNSMGGSGGAGGYIRMEAGDGAVGDGVAGAAGYIEITGGYGLVQGGDVTITGGSGGTTHGKVRLSTSGHNWDFRADGGLTLPNGAGFGLGDSGQLKVNDSTTQSLDLRDANGRGFYTNGDGYALRSNGNNTWQFDTSGTLTLPYSNYLETTDTNLKVGSQGTVTIRSNAANSETTKSWTFGNDGNLTVPGAITTITTPQVGSLTTIAVNDGGVDEIYGSEVLAVDYYDNVAILTTYGAGSTITFANGDVRTITAITDVGGEGYIDIAWTGSIGAGTNLTGFPITLKTANYAAASTAPANIVVNNNTWTFGNHGSLTFPDNTVQSTAYVAPTTGNATIISDPEGTTVSRNGMTIRVTSAGMIQMSFDSVINVKGRSSINNADSVVIASPNGVTTIGTWYNIGAVLAEGDHLTATIVDESYHHIYRLTAIIIQKTTPPGQEIVVSYAIIEQLQ